MRKGYDRLPWLVTLVGQYGYGELLATAIALWETLPCTCGPVIQLILRDLGRWILIIQTTKLVWIGYGTWSTMIELLCLADVFRVLLLFQYTQ